MIMAELQMKSGGKTTTTMLCYCFREFMEVTYATLVFIPYKVFSLSYSKSQVTYTIHLSFSLFIYRSRK